MQVVACSPLTKLFLPDWEDQLIENPELIFDETATFTFTVPRPAGAVAGVIYGVPFRVDDYLRNTHVGKDAKAAADLLQWLTGNDQVISQETDWTGLVRLDVGTAGVEHSLMQVHRMVMEAQMSGDETKIAEAKATMDHVLKASFQKTQGAMKKARAEADARVVSQLKVTQRNLMNQYKHNREDGKGLYAPSATEYFGAFVLRKIAQVSQKRMQMNEEFQNLIKQVGI